MIDGDDAFESGDVDLSDTDIADLSWAGTHDELQARLSRVSGTLPARYAGVVHVLSAPGPEVRLDRLHTRRGIWSPTR